MSKVAFGGSCHWCTEAIFQSLKGVEKVEQRWVASSDEEAKEFSEAVVVHFDEEVIGLEVLIEIHLHTHNATSNHSFRKKYRSAVYTFDAPQHKKTQAILALKQKLFSKPLVTKAYPFESFRLNDEKYLDYYKKNPEKPFCRVRIEPKLKLLINGYRGYIKV